MNNSIETSEREGVEPRAPIPVPGEETLKQRVRFAINNADVLHTPAMYRGLLAEQRCVIERAVAALLGEEQVALVKLSSIQRLSEALGHPDVVLVKDGETPEDGLIRTAVERLSNAPQAKPKEFEPGLALESGEFVSASELNKRWQTNLVRCPICLGVGQFNTLTFKGNSTTPCSACNGEGMILG
jgi:hypothetical protein